MFSGQAAMSLLQHARQGDRTHQVFPCFLLWMSQDALRHAAEEVPQVQLCLRSQWLSPHLHYLNRTGDMKKRNETVENQRGGQKKWYKCKRSEHSENSDRSVFPVFLFKETSYYFIARRILLWPIRWWHIWECCAVVNKLLFVTQWYFYTLGRSVWISCFLKSWAHVQVVFAVLKFDGECRSLFVFYIAGFR